MIKPVRIVILYDSIYNSVFESQVASPLAKRTVEGEQIVLISFERDSVCLDLVSRLKRQYGFHAIHIYYRGSFFGQLSLRYSLWKLRKLLCNFTEYELQARGPLAGWLALRAVSWNNCRRLTIQVRGLLAEEYAYTTPRALRLCTLESMRYRLYRLLERSVYQDYKKFGKNNVLFEAVSPALKEYMHALWGVLLDDIKLAQDDIPPVLPDTKRTYWRNKLRKELSISSSSVVYCYSGSLKAWQCPEETVSYFLEAYRANPLSFLLILTPEPLAFTSLLRKFNLSHERYRVLKVSPTDLYRYLAVADKGLIFRKPHIINWTSRPTKAVEYASVSLPIVHNNTIAYLCETEIK